MPALAYRLPKITLERKLNFCFFCFMTLEDKLIINKILMASAILSAFACAVLSGWSLTSGQGSLYLSFRVQLKGYFLRNVLPNPHVPRSYAFFSF